MITQEEYSLLLNKCRELPPAEGNYIVLDYMENIFITVLDFMLKGNIIKKAINYYRDNRWNEIRTHSDLKKLLSQYADDQDGNTAIAQYLWGYKYWTRVSLMRKLAFFLESIDVKSQEALVKWANKSTFENDFKGKIPGMNYAIYQWLIMRQGIETIKPDVHVRRFVESIVKRSDFTDSELVNTFESIAKQLELKAYELDWRIWEYQRTK